ncbi:MAG: hypothetical protein J0M19_08595 [Sphingomonadales bacterium]|nr:hypothetical protein [Sphingomonadales bacterium]
MKAKTGIDDMPASDGNAPLRTDAMKAKIGPDRLDGYLLLLVGLAGTALFASRIDWLHYAVLFWVIDVLGYWPGVARAHLTKTRHLPRGFTHLYNLMHSNTGGLALALGSALVWPGSIASALAIPVHLGIDRGILGNRLKRPEDPF